MSFTELGLHTSLVKQLTKQGHIEPTAIQTQAIPAILNNKDVLAQAQTGSGKTLAYVLPALQQLAQKQQSNSNQARALILVPTRELAVQLQIIILSYCESLKLRSVTVYGGVKINPQMMKLRSGTDILIATPGRLLDLFEKNAIKFSHLELLVLDEADRMLALGFSKEVNKIIRLLPQQRQTLLFSATFSDMIRELARSFQHHPIEISVDTENTAADSIVQTLYSLDKAKKSDALIKLISDHNWQQVLVFCNTKHGANRLEKRLAKNGISVAVIHGDKSQSMRSRALNDFKNRQVSVLLATDLAARGLDIEQLPQVINFELPAVAENYIHRIGRTGRAGSGGEAISLVCADEFKLLKAIERLTKQLIPRKNLSGFEASEKLPESILDTRPLKPKRPKKPKKQK